jgi:hypothetical protein
MGGTKDVGKHGLMVRPILGSILIVFSFFMSGIFWVGIGLIGAIIVVSALLKYLPLNGFLLKVFSKEGKEKG